MGTQTTKGERKKKKSEQAILPYCRVFLCMVELCRFADYLNQVHPPPNPFQLSPPRTLSSCTSPERKGKERKAACSEESGKKSNSSK
mmetsp:Transcript_38996/g.76659  ORF Transcript_38996/g.76659 Transcript_38996/m.76659 type:complete len:87 (+) Transcript_38996:309-569(+)